MMTATMTSWQENHHQNERILMKLLMRTPIVPRLIFSARETLGFNPNLQPVCTWWLIPLSKWVITPVISGLTLLIPFITGVVTHLLSGMSHQAGWPLAPGDKQWKSPVSVGSQSTSLRGDNDPTATAVGHGYGFQGILYRKPRCLLVFTTQI